MASPWVLYCPRVWDLCSVYRGWFALDLRFVFGCAGGFTRRIRHLAMLCRLITPPQNTVLLLNCAQKTPPHQFQVFLIRWVIMCWDDPFHQQIRFLKVPEPSLFRGIRMNVPWVIPHMWLISVQVDFDLVEIQVPNPTSRSKTSSSCDFTLRSLASMYELKVDRNWQSWRFFIALVRRSILLT